MSNIYKKDCFAFSVRKSNNEIYCSALTKIDCEKCKFYKPFSIYKKTKYWRFKYYEM